MTLPLNKLTYTPFFLSLADKGWVWMTGAERIKFYKDKKRAKANERRKASYQKAKLKKAQEKAEREKLEPKQEPKELTKEEKMKEWRRQYMRRKRLEEKQKKEREEKRKEKDRERKRRVYWEKKAAREQERDESSENEVECMSSLQSTAVQTETVGNEDFGDINSNFCEHSEMDEASVLSFNNFNDVGVKQESFSELERFQSLEGNQDRSEASSDMKVFMKIDRNSDSSDEDHETKLIIKEELLN